MNKPPWMEFRDKEHNQKLQELGKNAPGGLGIQMKANHKKVENLAQELAKNGKIVDDLKEVSKKLGKNELETIEFLIDFYRKAQGIL